MKTTSLIVALALISTPLYAQTTIKAGSLPATTADPANLTDTVVSESSCGTCLMSVAKILDAGLYRANTYVYAQSVNINTTAGMTTDTYGLNVQLNNPSASGAQIYAMLCPSCRPNSDAIRGVATATTGTTNTNTNGIAGYVLNQNASGNGGQNSVALFGVGISAVNGAETWGINTNLTDNTSGFTVSTGTGRTLLSELDYNVTSPYTAVIGLVLQGAAVSQPASSTGFLVGNMNLAAATAANQAASVPWQNAFESNNGAATTALYVGSTRLDAQANQYSQYVAFAYRNSSAVASALLMYADPLGELVVTGPAIVGATNATTSLGNQNDTFLEVWTNSTRLTPTTVVALPTCSSSQVGQMMFVTDATSPTVYGTLTGGGGYGMIVTCFNGTWVPH